MMHQKGRAKLNRKPAHRRSMLRNQVIHLITYGHLVTTKARVKEVRRMAEKAITIARKGNEFNVRRRLNSLLPYDGSATLKLVKEIAPRYVDRPGGYTRMIPMGRRGRDMAQIARLEFV